MRTVEKYGIRVGIDVHNLSSRGKNYLRAVARSQICRYFRTRYKQKSLCYIEESDGEEWAGGTSLASHDDDIDARLDAKATLATLPKRLIQIGHKILNEENLSNTDQAYRVRQLRKLRPKLNCRHQANELSEWERRRVVRLHCKGLHVWPIARTLGRSYRNVNICLIKAGLREAPREEEAAEGKILKILRKHPKGMTRSEFSPYFYVPAREVDCYLAPMIKKGEVLEIKRENTRGRPLSPLFLIAGATIPEEKNVKEEHWKNVKEERDNRIRQAYKEGWSIRRINRELHHDKRTIRRAIRSAGII
jgi:DNA-binding NarL/FixJ family response regulator